MAPTRLCPIEGERNREDDARKAKARQNKGHDREGDTYWYTLGDAPWPLTSSFAFCNPSSFSLASSSSLSSASSSFSCFSHSSSRSFSSPCRGGERQPVCHTAQAARVRKDETMRWAAACPLAPETRPAAAKARSTRPSKAWLLGPPSYTCGQLQPALT